MALVTSSYIIKNNTRKMEKNCQRHSNTWYKFFFQINVSVIVLKMMFRVTCCSEYHIKSVQNLWSTYVFTVYTVVFPYQTLSTLLYTTYLNFTFIHKTKSMLYLIVWCWFSGKHLFTHGQSKQHDCNSSWLKTDILNFNFDPSFSTNISPNTDQKHI